jgi:hypothetical protein
VLRVTRSMGLYSRAVGEGRERRQDNEFKEQLKTLENSFTPIPPCFPHEHHFQEAKVGSTAIVRSLSGQAKQHKGGHMALATHLIACWT